MEFADRFGYSYERAQQGFSHEYQTALEGHKGMDGNVRLFQCLDAIPEYRLAALQDPLIAEWTCASAALEGNTFSLGDTEFFLREG